MNGIHFSGHASSDDDGGRREKLCVFGHTAAMYIAGEAMLGVQIPKSFSKLKGCVIEKCQLSAQSRAISSRARERFLLQPAK